MLIGAGVFTSLAGLGTSLRRTTREMRKIPAKMAAREIRRERRVLVQRR